MKYKFDFDSVLAQWPLFMHGAWLTVKLALLATSITSQISAEELTAIANRVQSDTFRSFETYVVVAVFYLVLSLLMRIGFRYGGVKTA